MPSRNPFKDATPWFPGTVYPIRSGVYQREFVNGKARTVRYALYHDGQWYLSAKDPREASLEDSLSMATNVPWRGMTVRVAFP